MSRVIPKGHEVAGLGRRFLAYLIDFAPVAIISGILTLVLRTWAEPTVMLVASIFSAVLILAYALYQWWAYASGGAGLGARATGLSLVGLQDGQPIGWWRVFLRFLVWLGLTLTVVGGIAFVVFLIIDERRQGWHDMAVKSVLVQPKAVAESEKRVSRTQKGTTSTVGLPPHLADAFSPEANYASEWAPQYDGAQEYQPQAGYQQPAFPDQQQQPFPGGGYGQSPVGPPMGGQPQQPPRQPVQQQFQPQQPDFGGAPQWQGPGQLDQGPGFGQGPQPQRSASGPMGPHPQQSGPSMPPPQPQRSMSSANPPEPQPRSTPLPGWIPMPTPSSVLEPSNKSVRVRPRDFGDVEEDEGTTIAALPPVEGGRAGDEGWYVRLDDGREVELNVTVLLGRNPQRSESDPEVHLVPSSGDGRMISRTHVLIGTDLRGVYIVDRGSTNGTALVTEAGQLEPAPEGVQMRVREGQQVSYGNRWFTVLRRPAQIS